MHLTLKKEATRPPGLNSLQQQARFDDFVKEFNTERPHEALGMKTPGRALPPLITALRGLPEIDYPLHDRESSSPPAAASACTAKRSTSQPCSQVKVGIKEVDDGIWLVSFMHYDLGYIDLEQRTLQTIDNPFGARLSPMS